MKIAFNLIQCGAGNNGGTRTLFKSAIELKRQGHWVEFWADMPNMFTWFPLPETIPFYTSGNPLHDVDVVVATGTRTVPSTISCKNTSLKAFWIRAIETWQPGALEAIKKAHACDVFLMVNSCWMQQYLMENFLIPAWIVYPGLETKFFVPPEAKLGPVQVGALHSSKPRKRAEDVHWLFSRLKKSYGDRVRRVILTAESHLHPGNFPCHQSIHHPSEERKRLMYQNTNIWFAPTDNEGLHVPPMEAGLCGCALVAHDIPSAGMMDYALPDETALCYPKYNREAAWSCVEKLIECSSTRAELAEALRQRLLTHIGSRSRNMKRMVGLFEEVLND